MLKFRSILHPTDFSESSHHAFQVACSMARDHGGSLTLLYVGGPVISTGLHMLPDAEETQHPILDKLTALQQEDANVKMSALIRHGDPAEEILRVANETKADLIVMGTHGRTGLARLIAGSVAESVLRNAPCPVLAVRTPSSESAT